MKNIVGSKTKSLAALLTEYFGVKTTNRSNPEGSAIAITVTRAANNNPRRLGLVIINIGANPAYFLPDNSVSTTKGIYLASGGGSLSLKWDEDFELVSHDWYGIASGGATTILLSEVFII